MDPLTTSNISNKSIYKHLTTEITADVVIRLHNSLFHFDRYAKMLYDLQQSQAVILCIVQHVV